MPIHQEESIFNMALAYLKRIDKLLTLCQQAAFTGNIDSWLNYLRGVYREASVRLTEDEKTDVLGKDYKIDIKKLLDNNIEDSEANFKSINFLMNNSNYKSKNRNTIMFLLDALDVKLRNIMQKRNMLLPSKQDPTKAVLDI